MAGGKNPSPLGGRGGARRSSEKDRRKGYSIEELEPLNLKGSGSKPSPKGRGVSRARQAKGSPTNTPNNNTRRS